MDYNSTKKNTVKDYTLNVDKFKKQNILKGKFAKINMFINLLLMEKNTIQHNPDAGFDLQSYMHLLDDEAEIGEMEEELRNQCNIYLPFGMSGITIEKVEPDALKIEALTEDNLNFSIESKKDNIFDLSIEIPEKDFNR